MIVNSCFQTTHNSWEFLHFYYIAVTFSLEMLCFILLNTLDSNSLQNVILFFSCMKCNLYNRSECLIRNLLLSWMLLGNLPSGCVCNASALSDHKLACVAWRNMSSWLAILLNISTILNCENVLSLKFSGFLIESCKHVKNNIHWLILMS